VSVKDAPIKVRSPFFCAFVSSFLFPQEVVWIFPPPFALRRSFSPPYFLSPQLHNTRVLGISSWRRERQTSLSLPPFLRRNFPFPFRTGLSPFFFVFLTLYFTDQGLLFTSAKRMSLPAGCLFSPSLKGTDCFSFLPWSFCPSLAFSDLRVSWAFSPFTCWLAKCLECTLPPPFFWSGRAARRSPPPLP